MTRIIDPKVLRIEWDPVQSISFSKAKLWKKCKQAFHYKYVQKLEKRKKALPLIIGTAIHAVIEEYQEGRDPQVPMDQFRKDFNKLFNEEKAELGDLPTVLEGIMETYFKKYENDGLTYPMRRWGLKTEIPVKVYLDNYTQFVGYVDKFPQDQEGRNWVMDHKSCKSIPDEASRFGDTQLVLYVEMLPMLGYPRPDGVIWDYVKKKAPVRPEQLKAGGLSMAKKIDTTYEVYMDTVDKVLGPEHRPKYEEFAQTLKGREEKFLRRIYLPNPSRAMVDTVVQDLVTTAKEIRLFAPTSTVRGQSRDCSWCSYYNLCQAELRGLDSDFIRKADYTIKGEVNVEEETDDEPSDTSDE